MRKCLLLLTVSSIRKYITKASNKWEKSELSDSNKGHDKVSFIFW